MTKVVDTVRGSILFTSVPGFIKGVKKLHAGGGDDIPVPLRTKDRVTFPLDSVCYDIKSTILLASLLMPIPY